MTATLPLQSWRMFTSTWNLRNYLGRRDQAIDGDGTRLGAAVKADATSGAVVTCVVRRVHAVVAQLRSKFQAFGRTGLDTQPASFALLDVDGDVAARCSGHGFTSELHSVPLVDAATTWSSRNTRTTPPEIEDARSQPW